MPPVSTGVQSLTIAEVLAEFLAEQQKGLSPRTFTGYRDVVSLLQPEGHEPLNVARNWANASSSTSQAASVGPT